MDCKYCEHDPSDAVDLHIEGGELDIRAFERMEKVGAIRSEVSRMVAPYRAAYQAAWENLKAYRPGTSEARLSHEYMRLVMELHRKEREYMIAIVEASKPWTKT